MNRFFIFTDTFSRLNYIVNKLKLPLMYTGPLKNPEVIRGIGPDHTIIIDTKCVTPPSTLLMAAILRAKDRGVVVQEFTE